MDRQGIKDYIGSRVKMFRENRNLTQRELGGMLEPHRSVSMISGIELGTQNVDLYLAYQIAVALKIELTDLLPRVGK
jgi:transcriptional regulator with XRE-family HTH domain